jgi:nitroimidazol reductase NimA-like FMN-containing flavoprotein (pyridoxamine 5'-phosphate oxidase superfamily)
MSEVVRGRRRPVPITGQRTEAFEVLTRQECLRLLGQKRLGRVAGSTGGRPAVVPVRFALVRDDIVFVADPKGRLDRAMEDEISAFEVDLLDPAEGWSVVVTGPAAEVTDDDELRRLRTFVSGSSPPDSDQTRLFRLATGTLSGRRILRQPMYVAGSIRAAAVSTRPAQPDGATDDLPDPLDDVRVENLTRDECMRWLATTEVGRFVVVLHGEPRVFPVNYALDGEAVVFRTAPGAKLEGVSRSLAAFQVDHLIPGSVTGWSVEVEGIAQEITSADSPALHERIDALHVRSWASGDRSYFVRILPIAVRGTRYGQAVGAEGSGPSALSGPARNSHRWSSAETRLS